MGGIPKIINLIYLLKRFYLTLIRLSGRTIPVSIKTKHNFVILGILPEDVSSRIWLNKAYEIDLEMFLQKILKKGEVFVDIGAHFGYFSILASKIVGKNGRIYSFEPTPSTFKILKSNTNRLKNVSLNNLAVFSKDERMEIIDYGITKSAYNSLSSFKPRLKEKVSGKRFDVRAIRLDSFFKKKKLPNFVKIDAEESELEVLKGMKKVIKKNRPIITLEVGDGYNDSIKKSSDYILFLNKLGYTPYEFVNGQIKKHQLKKDYSYQNILMVPIEKTHLLHLE